LDAHYFIVALLKRTSLSFWSQDPVSRSGQKTEKLAVIVLHYGFDGNVHIIYVLLSGEEFKPVWQVTFS
jgi:hypothetical protein